MRLYYDSVSERGLVRPLNQDAIYGMSEDGWGLFVVADGMGGHQDGEKASTQIVDCLEEMIEQGISILREGDLEEVRDLLEDAVSEANRRIRRFTREGELCGSTVVILFFREERYLLLWAGDSRCYTATPGRQGQVYQLSRDDVVREGPACVDPRDIGKLTRAVGILPTAECSLFADTWEDGQIFFLCTDGIYKFMDPDALNQLLHRSIRTHGNGILEQMTREVIRNGAGDNYSGILINVLKK